MEYPLVNKADHDYKEVNKVVGLFAEMGKEAKHLPRLHFKNQQYKYLYNGAYKNKCPDLSINGVFYEYESFEDAITTTKIRNMLRAGFKQSSRVIINNPDGLHVNYIKKSLFERVKQGIKVDEVWMLTNKGLEQVF